MNMCCLPSSSPTPRRTGYAPFGRIELYSDEIARFGYDDCPPHPCWIEPAEWLGSRQAAAFPLHLVSSQPRHKPHSQMDAGPVSARGKTAGRETLAINPADAKTRGIGNGEVVRVFNARGACFAGVSIAKAVSPGVVRLSCGAWYDPADDDEKPACAHGNANVLTRDHGTSRLSQGPSSATALVEVEKCTNPPPPRQSVCAGAADGECGLMSSFRRTVGAHPRKAGNSHAHERYPVRRDLLGNRAANGSTPAKPESGAGAPCHFGVRYEPSTRGVFSLRLLSLNFAHRRAGGSGEYA
jgi:hypothetical protein